MSHKPSLMGSIGLFVLATILLIVPLPHWAHVLRPQWMLLLLLVWARRYHASLSLYGVFVIGLFVDLLLGTVLAMHAFTYVLALYLFSKYDDRMINFPLLQQTLCIFLVVLVAYVSRWLVAVWFASDAPTLSMFCSVATTAVLWPWLMMLFQPALSPRSRAGLT